MEKAIQSLTYLFLAGLPFVYYYAILSPYEIPKVWMIWIVAIMSVGLGVATKTHDFNRRLVELLLILLTWLVLGAWWSGDFWQSWWGNPYRMDGSITLFALIIIGMTMRVKPQFLMWVGWGGVVMAAWVIIKGNYLDPLTMGNVNFLAGYLALTMPLVWEYVRPRWLTALPFIAVFAIGSWGGVLTIGCWLVITILYKYPKWLMFVLGALGLLIVVLYVQDFQKRLLPSEIVAECRSRIFGKALIAIKERPLTGWGWARFSVAFAQIDYPFHYYIDANVDRTHSSILEFGVAGGLPALALYLAIVGIVVAKLRKSENRLDAVFGTIVLLYVIQSQTNVTSVAQDYLFWLGVGRAINET